MEREDAKTAAMGLLVNIWELVTRTEEDFEEQLEEIVAEIRSSRDWKRKLMRKEMN